MNSLAVLAVLILTFVAAPIRGLASEWQSLTSFQGRYDRTAQAAHSTTLTLCRDFQISSWTEIFGDSTLHSLRADETFMSLAPQTLALLESDGYLQGLEECFPGDQFSKDTFTMALITVSSVGRGVGFVGAIGGVGLAGQKLATQTGKVWDALSRTKTVLANPRLAWSMAQTGRAARFTFDRLDWIALGGVGIVKFYWMNCERIPSCVTRRDQMIAKEQLVDPILLFQTQTNEEVQSLIRSLETEYLAKAHLYKCRGFSGIQIEDVEKAKAEIAGISQLLSSVYEIDPNLGSLKKLNVPGCEPYMPWSRKL